MQELDILQRVVGEASEAFSARRHASFRLDQAERVLRGAKAALEDVQALQREATQRLGMISSVELEAEGGCDAVAIERLCRDLPGLVRRFMKSLPAPERDEFLTEADRSPRVEVTTEGGERVVRVTELFPTENPTEAGLVEREYRPDRISGKELEFLQEQGLRDARGRGAGDQSEEQDPWGKVWRVSREVIAVPAKADWGERRNRDLEHFVSLAMPAARAAAGVGGLRTEILAGLEAVKAEEMHRRVRGWVALRGRRVDSSDLGPGGGQGTYEAERAELRAAIAALGEGAASGTRAEWDVLEARALAELAGAAGEVRRAEAALQASRAALEAARREVTRIVDGAAGREMRWAEGRAGEWIIAVEAAQEQVAAAQRKRRRAEAALEEARQNRRGGEVEGDEGAEEVLRIARKEELVAERGSSDALHLLAEWRQLANAAHDYAQDSIRSERLREAARGAILARSGSVSGVRAGLTEWGARAAGAGARMIASVEEAVSHWRMGVWEKGGEALGKWVSWLTREEHQHSETMAMGEVPRALDAGALDSSPRKGVVAENAAAGLAALRQNGSAVVGWVSVEGLQAALVAAGCRVSEQEARRLLLEATSDEVDDSAAEGLGRGAREMYLEAMLPRLAEYSGQEGTGTFDWQGRTILAQLRERAVEGSAESVGDVWVAARDADWWRGEKLPARLWDPASEEAVWNSSGVYARLADVEAVLGPDTGLWNGTGLLGALGLPLALALPPLAKEAASAASGADLRPEAELRPEAGCSLGDDRPGEPDEVGAAEEGGANCWGNIHAAGEEGLVAVGRALAHCGFVRQMPCYSEMRRLGLRSVAAAVRDTHGGLRRAASQLWTLRSAAGLDEEFALLPLPRRLVSVPSGEVLWGPAQCLQELHRILAEGRPVAHTRDGRGVLVCGAARFRCEFVADDFSSLSAIEAVVDTLAEDLRVVREGDMPMYAELGAIGLEAVSKAVLEWRKYLWGALGATSAALGTDCPWAESGMHLVSKALELRGPWERGPEERRSAREAAAGRRLDGVGTNIDTREWSSVLRVVLEFADESPKPEMMPSYRELEQGGLAHVARALRNRSACEPRVQAGELVPHSASGLSIAAEQLGLQCAAASAKTAAGDPSPPRLVVEVDLARRVARFAPPGALRAALQEVANGRPWIPSYAEMRANGAHDLAEAVRQRPRGMLGLLELFSDAPRSGGGGAVGSSAPGDRVLVDEDVLRGEGSTGSLRLPYLHRALDLGPRSGPPDSAAGCTRELWDLEEAWVVRRALADLAFELRVLDRLPRYSEMRAHGWGALADHILQTRHRSDCPRSGRAAGAAWAGEPCACLELLLADRSRVERASERLWAAREAALADGASSEQVEGGLWQLQRTQERIEALAQVQLELKLVNHDYEPVDPAEAHDDAPLAGLPSEVVQRFDELCAQIETEPSGQVNAAKLQHKMRWGLGWPELVAQTSISFTRALEALGVAPPRGDHADMAEALIDIYVPRADLVAALAASRRAPEDWWGAQTSSESSAQIEEARARAVAALAPLQRGMSRVQADCGGGDSGTAPLSRSCFLRELFAGMAPDEEGRVRAEGLRLGLLRAGVKISHVEAARMVDHCLARGESPAGGAGFQGFRRMLLSSRIRERLLAPLPPAGGAGAPPHETGLDLWGWAIRKMAALEKTHGGAGGGWRAVLRQQVQREPVEVPPKVLLPRLLLKPPGKASARTPPLDVVLLLDACEAMSGKHWAQIRALAESLVRALERADEGIVRCGWVQFAGDMWAEFRPTVYLDQMHEALQRCNMAHCQRLRALAAEGDAEAHAGWTAARDGELGARITVGATGVADMLEVALDRLQHDPERTSKAELRNDGFIRPHARHAVVLFSCAETLQAHAVAGDGMSLAGTVTSLRTRGVELFVVGKGCTGERREQLRMLASSPKCQHLIMLPPPELAAPLVERTRWDELLCEVEEWVDTSSRARHAPTLISLRRDGRRDLATAIQQLTRQVDAAFREERSAVLPRVESGVALVAEELGLLLPTTTFEYHPQEAPRTAVDAEMGYDRGKSSGSAGEWSEGSESEPEPELEAGAARTRIQDGADAEEALTAQQRIALIVEEVSRDRAATLEAARAGLIEGNHERVTECTERLPHHLHHLKALERMVSDEDWRIDALLHPQQLPDAPHPQHAPVALQAVATTDPAQPSRAVSKGVPEAHLGFGLLAAAPHPRSAASAPARGVSAESEETRAVGALAAGRRGPAARPTLVRDRGVSDRLQSQQQQGRKDSGVLASAGNKLNQGDGKGHGKSGKGTANFRPPNAGFSRTRALPRSVGDGCLSVGQSLKSAGGVLPCVKDVSQVAFVQGLRMGNAQLSREAVLHAVHTLAGRPPRQHLLKRGVHPDDADLVRLLPTRAQLSGAGLHHVAASIARVFGGARDPESALVLLTDPHGLRTWGPHDVARHLEAARARLGSAAVSRYKRAALARRVNGARLLDMSPAHLREVLGVEDSAHRHIIYRRLLLARALHVHNEIRHGSLEDCHWPRTLTGRPD